MVSLFYLVLGILAIISAIRYTVGNTAYAGFGDVFVFVFFGLVSTLGVNFIPKQLDFELVLPAIAIGLLSVVF
jgi:1,4-dihydroxy-2-naphthoate octaprenyltransferase